MVLLIAKNVALGLSVIIVIIEGQEQTNMQKNYEHPTQALDMSNLFKHKLPEVNMKIRKQLLVKH
jgi:hypothetical protein